MIRSALLVSSCINEWFALSLISARDQPGWRCRSPCGQSGGRRRYHSIARAGHRRRSITRSPGTAGIVAGVRDATPAGVRTPTSPILCLAERELLRYGLSERSELEFVIVEEADELKWKFMGDQFLRDWTFDLGYRILKFTLWVFPLSSMPLTSEYLKLLKIVYNIYLFLLFKYICL